MARTLSISTGLILFVFVCMHLINLSVGVISVDWILVTRPVFMTIWANQFGGALLLSCILIHLILGLRSLYLRNTLSMTAHDTVQFASAFLIPLLIVPHIWGIVAVKQWLMVHLTYPDLFKYFWIDNPLEGLRQVLLVIIVWIHGCIGIFTWLKLKAWWPRISNFMYPLAVIIPVLALLGFVAGGNQVLVQPPPLPDLSHMTADQINAAYSFIEKTKWMMIQGYLLVIAAVLVARWLRVRGNTKKVEVLYADGQTVSAVAGPTLLDIANLNDVPHANLCRGRGRCGTCRVIIHESEVPLPSPSEMEQQTLDRLHSPAGTRLACQVAPIEGKVRIERFLSPDILHSQLHEREGQDQKNVDAEVTGVPS